MVDPAIAELVNKEIDGANSSEESARLQGHIAANDEVKHFFNEMRDLSRSIATIPEVDVPVGMKRNIIEAIVHHGELQHKHKRVAARMKEFFWPQSPLRFAYVFSGGLAFGVLIAMLISVPSERGDIPHDLMASGSILDRSDEFHVLKRADVVKSGVSIGLRIGARSTWRSVDVDVAAEGPVIARITADAQSLEFKAVVPSQGDEIRLTRNGDTLEITTEGAQHYQVLLVARNSTPSLRVEIASLTGILYQDDVSLFE